MLALRVCVAEPTAAFAVRLLREAVEGHGASRHLVSDQGPQLTSAAFGGALKRRGIRRRFGAIGKTGSVALIERFWGSMKREYARGLFLYRPLATIERQMRSFALWYNTERPHTSLGFLTPDDVHYGRTRRRPRAIARGILAVRFIGGDHRLPVLRLRDAA